MTYSNLSPAALSAILALGVTDFIVSSNWNCDPVVGIRWLFRFSNGYAASVVKHSDSYGNNEDLWELAVKDRKNKICHTPVCGDYDKVVGYLTDGGVVKLCAETAALPVW